MTTDLFFATLDRSFGGGGGSPFDDPMCIKLREMDKKKLLKEDRK